MKDIEVWAKWSPHLDLKALIPTCILISKEMSMLQVSQVFVGAHVHCMCVHDCASFFVILISEKILLL